MRLTYSLAVRGHGAAAQIQEISGERIRAHVKFLASDLLEGRGVGTRGGELATEYLAAQFALVGAKPAGDNGTYFQKRASGRRGAPAGRPLSQPRRKARRLPLRWLSDFVGSNYRQRPEDQFDAEAVFVGHGIVAPEFQWDDFKGADVRGKIVVLFTNEPCFQRPEVLRRPGAHLLRPLDLQVRAGRAGGSARQRSSFTPPPTAGYGWDVVRNSWGREEPFVKLQPGQPELAFAGWVTRGGRREAAVAGRQDRHRTAEGLRIARLQADPAGHPHPRPHPKQDPRHQHRQRGGHHPGQRSRACGRKP